MMSLPQFKAIYPAAASKFRCLRESKPTYVSRAAPNYRYNTGANFKLMGLTIVKTNH